MIKKELKTEHLAKNPVFYKSYFGSRPMKSLTNEEICEGYTKALLKEDHEGIGEWIVNCWVFRHGDIYDFFVDRLSQISPAFEEITMLTEEESLKVLEGAAETFGALPVYQFAVMNGVVLDAKVLGTLKDQAEKEHADKRVAHAENVKNEGLAQELERYKREMERLEKKYEDKLSGVMRKHAVDVEALKRQIRSLQQRLNDR
jgi:hypothetical protein